MRKLLFLVAVAALSAACHSRSEEEVGASPDRGDTTAVTATDTAAVTSDTTLGQTPNVTDTATVQVETGAGVSGDSAYVSDTVSAGVSIDTTSASPSDSTVQPQQ